VAQRDTSRSDKLKDRGTLIGTLIEEALFEFTSIDKRTETSTMFDARGTPISLGSFENVHNWASDMGELSLSSSDGLSSSGEGSSIEIGNLAALEDDSNVVASKGAQASYSGNRTSSPTASAPPAKPKRTGLIVAIVVLLLGATVAGLYVTGMVPGRIQRVLHAPK
jgi:hypothetical protein